MRLAISNGSMWFCWLLTTSTQYMDSIKSISSNKEDYSTSTNPVDPNPKYHNPKPSNLNHKFPKEMPH